MLCGLKTARMQLSYDLLKSWQFKQIRLVFAVWQPYSWTTWKQGKKPAKTPRDVSFLIFKLWNFTVPGYEWKTENSGKIWEVKCITLKMQVSYMSANFIFSALLSEHTKSIIMTAFKTKLGMLQTKQERKKNVHNHRNLFDL